ncbi:MAG: HupE/UreJ family protein [Methylococcales bacterium]
MYKAMLFLLIVMPPLVSAHKSSDSYITLTETNGMVNGRWDIALRDLEYAIGVDKNGDGVITWGELRAKQTEIENYAFSRFSVTGSGTACAINRNQLQVGRHSDGQYAVLNFDLLCSLSANRLLVDYRLFFDLDPTHRGLVNIQSQTDTEFLVFSPENTKFDIKLNQSNQLGTIMQFFQEGVWHIWKGTDHILFLLCLLLPVVVRREQGRWVCVNNFREVNWQVAKIVTAFTFAHSITLSLAVLDIVALPSQFVEATIAFSVILAAANNIFPLFNEKAWQFAFIFGLIHGFGFASVLSELELSTTVLGSSIFGFNLGVEVGQLVIVALFLPLAYSVRSYKFYQHVVLRFGSQLIMAIAAVWFTQRAFNVDLFQL